MLRESLRQNHHKCVKSEDFDDLRYTGIIEFTLAPHPNPTDSAPSSLHMTV